MAKLEDIGTVLLSVAALSIAGVGAWQKLSKPSLPQAPMTSNWRTYAYPGNEFGPAQAKVTVIEFSDFQCPYCARAARAIDDLLKEYPRDVRVVFRHYPVLSLHKDAYTAAVAAECAALQGRFREYHDALFAQQENIGKTPWKLFATRANVGDTASFRVCLDRQQTKARVDQDMQAARDLRIRGTPLLLVNGQHVNTGDSVRIRQAVKAALK